MQVAASSPRYQILEARRMINGTIEDSSSFSRTMRRYFPRQAFAAHFPIHIPKEENARGMQARDTVLKLSNATHDRDSN